MRFLFKYIGCSLALPARTARIERNQIGRATHVYCMQCNCTVTNMYSTDIQMNNITDMMYKIFCTVQTYSDRPTTAMPVSQQSFVERNRRCPPRYSRGRWSGSALLREAAPISAEYRGYHALTWSSVQSSLSPRAEVDVGTDFLSPKSEWQN